MVPRFQEFFIRLLARMGSLVTGMGLGRDPGGLYKFSWRVTLLATISSKDKVEAIPIIANLAALGYRVLATSGTAAALRVHGVPAQPVRKIQEGSPNLFDQLPSGEIQLVINTPTLSRSQ